MPTYRDRLFSARTSLVFGCSAFGPSGLQWQICGSHPANATGFKRTAVMSELPISPRQLPLDAGLPCTTSCDRLPAIFLNSLNCCTNNKPATQMALEQYNAIIIDCRLPPPFLKWAGGKRWLSSRILELANPFNGRYIEPFLGGGAVFFALRPQKSLLSDVNAELINAYNAVKSDYSKVFSLLRTHQAYHSKEYYYRMRDYRPRCEYRQAARFIYLNRTCWNGLYRVNRKGEFNVPIGTKTAVLMPTDNWSGLSELLASAELVCGDFEESISAANKGDLIFADPPYTVKHNLNGFIKYNDSLFSWNDQVRLRDALVQAKLRGAKVILTNANHASIRDLYKNHFHMEAISRASVLAGSAVHRGQYEELLIS